MKRLTLIVGMLLMLLAAIPSLAQDSVPLPRTTEDSLIITWPPPVTEVWGTGDVIGSANITNMVYYYLEYKQLSDDLTEPENAPWVPASIAISETVVDGTLATLDTTTVPDGVYSLRLTANTEDGQSFHYVVSPVRVNNARFESVIDRVLREAGVEVAEEPEEDIVMPEDNSPRVTPSRLAVNIRRCTLVDNDRCPVIDHLPPDESAEVIGRSNNNTWYQIRSETGLIGWVSRTVIRESGDFGNVSVITPPTPLPPPPPPQVANAGPTSMAIQGGSAICGQPFIVQINIANTGNATSAAGTLTLQDVNVRTGETTFTGYSGFPQILPGGNFVAVVQVNTDVYYNEEHELRAFANSRQYSIRYTLAQGGCNVVAIP